MDKREREKRTSARARLQAVIALALVTACVLSTGGMAFAAEPGNDLLSPAETAAESPLVSPAETSVVSPVVTPAESPAVSPVETPVVSPAVTPNSAEGAQGENPMGTVTETPAITPTATPSIDPGKPAENPAVTETPSATAEPTPSPTSSAEPEPSPAASDEPQLALLSEDVDEDENNTNSITIKYDAKVKLEQIGSKSNTPELAGDNGMVCGGSDFNEDFSGSTGTYTVRGVDKDVVLTTLPVNAKGSPVKYTFKGWKHGEEIIQPGTTLSMEQLRDKTDADGTVTLTAEWTPYIQNKSGNNLIATVNYYVGLDIEVYGSKYDYDYKNWQRFTNSVYASRVSGTPEFDLTSSYHDIINHATSSEDAQTVNKTIREYVYKEFNGITFLDGMPTDEEVFNYIRTSTSSQDRLYINKSDVTDEIKPVLTPDRYMIRWYVVRYNSSDGFHVDGVISERPGTLVIKKTFSGDSATISEVKKGFTISVGHEENNELKKDYILTLNAPATSENATAPQTVGYSEYDAASDTYTWVIQGSRDTNYTIKESVYEASGIAADVTCEATYRILNNGSGDTATEKYDPSNGVSVTMLSYDDNTSIAQVQTVELHNSYTKPGVITVVKEDELTGGKIGNVKFTLTDGNGAAIPLYQKGNSPEYYTGRDEEYTAEAEYARTNSNGLFYLKLMPGSYTLKETIPGGYYGAKTVKFTVSNENKITDVGYADITDEAPIDNAHTWAQADTNGTTLTVKNLSRKFSVTVKNRWLNAAGDQKKQVTVSLMRNGVPLGGDYIKTLNADGECTWDNLPLFVNGGVAEYSVRVTKIGDINGSDILGVTDGFVDYSVTHDAAVYTLGEDGQKKATAYWQDESDASRVCFADHVLLGVNISPIDGALSIKKHSDSLDGEGLPDAEFGLYSDEACTKKLDYELVSDEGGVISMKHISPGTYYLREITPPANFALDKSVYKVVVTGGKATVTLYKDADGNVIESSDERYNYPVTDIVNETSLTLVVHNRTVEPGEALLKGAMVKLEKTDGEKPVTVAEFTLTNGTYTLNGLTRGTYKITQLTAQEGYKLYPDEYCFKIENGQLIPVVELMTMAMGERLHEPGWYPGMMDDESFLLTVYNEPVEATPPDDPDEPEPSPQPTESPVPTATPAPTPTASPTPATLWWHIPYGSGGLPQTGQLNWPVPVLAALGAALIATGLAVQSRGKRKREKR